MTPPAPGATENWTPDPLWPLFLRVLRESGRVEFVVVDQVPQVPGVTHPDDHALVDRSTGTIFLRASNSDGEMRASTGHELWHLAEPHASEEEVETATALVMVPLSEAIATRSRADVASLAERILVDPDLILTRLAYDAISERRAS